MLVLLREEFWKQSAPNSPFIAIEQFRNNSIAISKALRGKPSEKSLTKKKKRHFLSNSYRLWPVGRSRVSAFHEEPPLHPLFSQSGMPQ